MRNSLLLIQIGLTGTAAGVIQHGHIKTDNGSYPYGGWSQKITANRHFVSVIPKSYPLEKAGPVFCAGITMFNPLKTHGAGNGGLKVGIAGFGGLGQMGVLMAKKMGNHVSVISTSNKKETLAKEVFEITLIILHLIMLHFDLDCRLELITTSFPKMLIV